jgi:hypothetical protein
MLCIPCGIKGSSTRNDKTLTAVFEKKTNKQKCRILALALFAFCELKEKILTVQVTSKGLLLQILLGQ